MRRSERNNNGTVPAFFTRSRAKNFFGASSTEAPNSDANKEQPLGGESEIVVLESEIKTEQNGKTGQQTPENPKTQEGVQTQQQQKDLLPPKDEKASCEVSGDNQSSAKNSQQEQIDQEMKPSEEEPKVPVIKIEKFGSQRNQHKNVSATTKALQQMEDAKKNWKKKQKLPLCIRRRKMNQRLNKILIPKSGLIFLHELKPGCTFKIQEQPGSNPSVFVAQVEYNDKVLAVGQGLTKPRAKNAAAENAIKVLVAEALNQRALKRESAEGDEAQQYDTYGEDELMDTTDDVSLAGLASYAMYKMFTEWQSQGTDFPLLSFQQKKKQTVTKAPSMKKELPPDADKLHPSFLLNTMRPGIVSSELERSTKDNMSFVTMGYEIDGKMYTGSGTNKKEARKRAAKAALSDLYGLKYED